VINIIALIGKSGSGKSEIEKELVKQFGYKKVISYTTRPARKGERDGVDYWFQWDYQFEHSRSNFAEVVEYNGYYYGAHYNDIKDNSIIVAVPEGLRQLKQKEKEGLLSTKLLSFYIDSPDDRRAWNMLYRGDSEENVKNRLEKDKEVFKDVFKEIDLVFPNDQTLEQMQKNIDIIHTLYKRHIAGVTD